MNKKEEFLSLNFGLVEFGNMDDKERFRQYRRYLYEAGAIPKSDGMSTRVINQQILEKERSNNFEISAAHRFKKS